MRLALLTMLAVPLLLAGCRREQAPEASGELTAEELTAEASATTAPEPTTDAISIGVAPAAEPDRTPVDAAQVNSVMLRILSETAYLNERREYMLDILERDMAYLTLVVEDEDGRPVRGATPRFELTGSSRVLPIGPGDVTDDTGWFEFGVIGGQMGSERMRVTVKDRSLDIRLNVISLAAAGYAKLDEIEGGLRWEQLMQARLNFDDRGVLAEFPADIAAHNGKQVKLIGFMMPLEPEERQKHFLLTSNPPSCFFHIPGGPAGAVEVFTKKGIEASWDPIVLEGRFETVQHNELGVIYRLHDARATTK